MAAITRLALALTLLAGPAAAQNFGYTPPLLSPQSSSTTNTLPDAGGGYTTVGAFVTSFETINPTTHVITEMNATTRSYTAGACAPVGAGIGNTLILGSVLLATDATCLPPSPMNGQRFTLSSQVAVTAETVKDSTGVTTVATLALGILGVGASFQYEAGAWVRVQ